MSYQRQNESGGRTSGGPRRRGPSRPKAPGTAPRGKIEPLHLSDEPPDIATFSEWELEATTQQVIADMGITVPTPIQRLAIGPVLEGRDVIAKAETGTGKTLAFGAPIMSKIDPDRSSVLALALCPTRELAQQVASVLAELGKPRGINVALIVGGEPMHGQVEQLKGGAQVVVGTPGRVLDLYGQGFLSFPWTEFVVLDEADEMLEIGFIDDVKKILSFTPDERQTLHFSATFPPAVLTLARESTNNPVEIATAAGVSTVDSITQAYTEASQTERSLILMRLIENSAPDDVYLVFCDRRTEVDDLLRKLSRMRFSIKALHGGYDQASRFRVMTAFRTGDVKALVATDVASRGLDVNHVTHVVNFGVPQGIEDYTHRIGRTGRAGRTGKALTIVSRENAGRWRQILADALWDIPMIEASELTGRGPARGGRTERPARSEREAPAGGSERSGRPAGSERPAGDQPRERRPRRREDEERPRRRAETESPRAAEAPAPAAAPAAAEPAVTASTGDRRPRRKETTRQRLARERAEQAGGAASAPQTERVPADTARAASEPAEVSEVSEARREPSDGDEQRPRRPRRGRRGGSGGREQRQDSSPESEAPEAPAAPAAPAERTERQPPRERAARPQREPRREPQRDREPRREAAPAPEQKAPPKPRREPETPDAPQAPGGGFGAGL